MAIDLADGNHNLSKILMSSIVYAVEPFMYCLQYEWPCCIGYTNSSRREEVVQGMSNTTQTQIL